MLCPLYAVRLNTVVMSSTNLLVRTRSCYVQQNCSTKYNHIKLLCQIHTVVSNTNYCVKRETVTSNTNCYIKRETIMSNTNCYLKYNRYVKQRSVNSDISCHVTNLLLKTQSC